MKLVVVPVLVAAAFSSGYGIGVGIANVTIGHHVLALEHACAPMDTGGGVTQCTQPLYNNIDLPTTPCASDDGPGPCYYDAGNRDNHQGKSFWIDDEGTIRTLAP